MQMMSRGITRFEPELRNGEATEAGQARVAVRRVRAQLGLATDRFDPDWVWLLRRELRWVEQAIGDVADADALVGWVRGQQLDERDERARSDLVAELARERSRAQRRLVALFDSARYERMVRDLDRAFHPPAELAKTVRREWRSLKVVVSCLGEDPGDQDLHRLAMRVDRVRVGAELCKEGDRLAEALGRLRDVIDALQEASLTQGWLRHAAGIPTVSWDLLAGQLIERARCDESKRWDEWAACWSQARDKHLRAWLKA
jgi:CHAD domain-containing protein